jgi:hypothetical protein
VREEVRTPVPSRREEVEYDQERGSGARTEERSRALSRREGTSCCWRSGRVCEGCGLARMGGERLGGGGWSSR